MRDTSRTKVERENGYHISLRALWGRALARRKLYWLGIVTCAAAVGLLLLMSLILSSSPVTLPVARAADSQPSDQPANISPLDETIGLGLSDWFLETSSTIATNGLPPIATLSSQPVGLVNYNMTDITVGGTGVVAYKYKLDSGTWNAETSVSTHITFYGLSDGTHTVYVIGKDALGNWQTEAAATTASWTIDTIPPTATLSGQPTGAVNYNTASVVSS